MFYKALEERVSVLIGSLNIADTHTEAGRPLLSRSIICISSY